MENCFVNTPNTFLSKVLEHSACNQASLHLTRNPEPLPRSCSSGQDCTQHGNICPPTWRDGHIIFRDEVWLGSSTLRSQHGADLLTHLLHPSQHLIKPSAKAKSQPNFIPEDTWPTFRSYHQSTSKSPSHHTSQNWRNAPRIFSSSSTLDFYNTFLQHCRTCRSSSPVRLTPLSQGTWKACISLQALWWQYEILLDIQMTPDSSCSYVSCDPSSINSHITVTNESPASLTLLW